MAENKYIHELTEIAGASVDTAADWLVLEDVSASETKKLQYSAVTDYVDAAESDANDYADAVGLACNSYADTAETDANTYTDTVVGSAKADLAFWDMQRAKFTYNGASTAYTVKLSAGMYHVKDKVAKWVAELTSPAISSPVATTWYYLYLDYSAITSWTGITASELVWSSTAPTYSHTYAGWYNGDDRCIFSAYTNVGPTNIMGFTHDGGDCVMRYGGTSLYSGTPSNGWTEIDFTAYAPAFVTRMFGSGFAQYVDTNSSLMWRQHGDTGNGHYLTYVVTSDQDFEKNTCIFYGDSDQIFEVRFDQATAGNVAIVHTHGWFFPGGM